MEPSAKVSSRTPGAISRPGMGSGFAAGALGSAGDAGGTAGGGAGFGDAAGATVGAAAAITAGFSARGFSIGLSVIFSLVFSPAFSGASTRVAGASDGELRIEGAGSAVATRVGFTSASSLFFASDAKLPFGYLS